MIRYFLLETRLNRQCNTRNVKGILSQLINSVKKKGNRCKHGRAWSIGLSSSSANDKYHCINDAYIEVQEAGEHNTKTKDQMQQAVEHEISMPEYVKRKLFHNF